MLDHVRRHSETGLRAFAIFMAFVGIVAGGVYIKTGTIETPISYQARYNDLVYGIGIALMLSGLIWAWLLTKFAMVIETARDTQAMVSDLHSAAVPALVRDQGPAV